MLRFFALFFMERTLASAFRVALMPDYITFEWADSVDAGTATDVQACLDAAYDADSSFEAISFDSGTGDCLYHSGFITTVPQASSGQPDYWLRIDLHMQVSAVTSCLTDQDVRYLLMQMKYNDQACFEGSLDSATGLCTGKLSSRTYDYDAGGIKNGTGYRLSRTLAADSVNHLCDDVRDMKMIFDGKWYCYRSHTLNSSEQAQGESVISGDYCSKLFGSTTHVVKVSEPRERPYIRKFFGEGILLGATLRSGTTYQWYDGTTADDLPWDSGSPRGGSNTLVRIQTNNPHAVIDAKPPVTALVCKKPATKAAYNACAKFKTCT